MMFKKKMVLFAVFALFFACAAGAQQVTIDAALAGAVSTIGRTVPEGTKIAVLNMTSDYEKLSGYIIDELIVGLVNTGRFQVLPRGAVEMELANTEMSFQYSGSVSDESQKSLGKFLGAGTIISGSITRDSATSYRIMINAIDVESFTYQASNRIAVTDDSQMKQLVAASGGAAYYEDYTTAQRLGIGAMNIGFGMGSIMRRQNAGWGVAALELIGGVFILAGQVGKHYEEKPEVTDYDYEGALEEYNTLIDGYNAYTIIGVATAGAGIAFGFVLPFFLHKPQPSSTAAAPDFPLDLRLVSAQNGDLGVNLSYRLSF